MIELRFPIRRTVATLALSSVAPQMHIVIDMAAAALGRNAVKDLILMAIAARYGTVPPGQREGGYVVVEPRVRPVRLVMAVAASALHLTLVNILVRMTAGARARSRGPRRSGLITIGTERHVVDPTKYEIGPRVVEYRKIERDDIRVPSLVIRVARRALAVGHIGVTTVKSLAHRDIVTHCDVTADAERVLTLVFGFRMTLPTVIFVLRMGLCDRPGHEQGFQREGV